MTIPNYAVMFCDDMREEVGEKLTYVGVRGGDVIIPTGEKTLALPKLVVVVLFSWPQGKPPEGWFLNVSLPNDKGEPFKLPPAGAEILSPDRHTGEMSIMVHAHYTSVSLAHRDKVVVTLSKGRRRKVIGVLEAVSFV